MEKAIQIPTEDNHIIYGTLNWQDPQPKKLIIFVHGFSGNQNRHLFFNGAKFFPSKGLASFRFNLYSSKEDSRDLLGCSITTHAQDIDRVVDFFQDKYDEIHLIGHSLAGPSILHSAQNVKSIVLWDPSLVLEDSHMDYWSLDERREVYVNASGVEKVMSKQMYMDWSGSNERMLQLMRVPTKIICAGDGPLVERWDKVIDKVPIEHEYVVIDGANHGFDEEGKEEEVFAETLEYLQKF